LQSGQGAYYSIFIPGYTSTTIYTILCPLHDGQVTDCLPPYP